MKAYRIIGGEPVVGKIKVFGAKNLVTKAMVCALLGDSKSTLENVWDIGDVVLTQKMIETTGAILTFDSEKKSLIVDPTTMNSSVVKLPEEGSNRIPILMISALINKFQKATVPALAGCNIGNRPVDFHVDALIKFGAKVVQTETNFEAFLESNSQLKGCKIDLPYPSVGATETCLFLAVKAVGKSVINNAAMEPEIMELITMLQGMGAIINVYPNRKIVIEGVSNLNGTYSYMLGDRIDAASWACLAGASGGEITLEGVSPSSMSTFLSYFQSVGGGVEFVSKDAIKFYQKGKLINTMIETDVYPGFSTDYQQPFAILLTQAEGVSVIHETVYENRFGYLKALNQFGANTQISTFCLGPSECRFKDSHHKHSAIITGKTLLRSDNYTIAVPDLRAGLSYVIAASIASGETHLTGVETIKRGYGNIVERTKNTNLKISEVEV
jgi:UDP-N-acetylglucosamine 1-carboxyvinyltransferase